MQHVLPRGFVRVRHYGLLANRGREEKLQRCRRLLCWAGVEQRLETTVQAAKPEQQGQRLCPVCGQGEMQVVEVLAAWPRTGPKQRPDSS